MVEVTQETIALKTDFDARLHTRAKRCDRVQVMPLIRSTTKAAVSENVRREVEAGRPQKQAVAIALETKRRAARPAKVRELAQHNAGGSKRTHTAQRGDIGTGG